MGNALKALAEELLPMMLQAQGRQYGTGYKHDASGTPIAVGYSHGPGGNLSYPGVDPAVFHTHIGTRSMLGQLPTIPTLYTNPTYYVMTGVQAASGSEPETVCANAPTAGLMKSCLVTSVFGRYERATAELELNRLGQQVDRADPMDLTLVGSPLGNSGVFGAGPQSSGAPVDLLRNEISRKFWERNVAFDRLLAQQLFIGNPDNNNAGGGYREITGFDILINTGYVDAESGQACASVDSYVRNLNFTIRVDTNPGEVIAAITDMFYQVRDRAERMGYNPVRWVFAMRPQLFYELTAVWPCSYLSYRCNLTGTSATEFVDAQDAVRFRDEMRAGKYLLIDGIRVEVVTDDGIAELNGDESGSFPRGCFASDIYLIPMSVVGGRATTYLEYFQYANQSLQDALGNLVLGRVEGAFLTWPRQTNQCVVWQSKIEPRLVLRTPWLAARLRNLVYCPIQHVREAFPEDPYHVDGGRTSRPGPSLFSIWQST